LQALIKEAAWNGKNLAEAVNAVGREANLPLGYSRSSVGQWIAGMIPRRPVPHIVAEALSRRLRRPVTLAEAGFDETPAEAEQRAEGPLRRLISLAVASDPGNLGTSPYRIYSLSGLAAQALAVTGEVQPVLASDPLKRFMRVDHKDVESADMMLQLFTDADAVGGAGYVRPGLGLYLANTIAPSLYVSAPQIRAELLPIAARLAHLCGLMCYDEELHGFAQQYYRVALRLCAEASEIGSRSLVLRAMSEQAVSLGHYDHALALAREAVSVAAVALSAPELATLLGQRAVARAAAGDRNGAVADMAAAQAHLKRVNGYERALRDAPEATLACQRGIMLALLGDAPSAIAQMELSVRRRPGADRRSRAITLSRIAYLQLRHGHLEEAIGTWHRFLDDYPAINSGRARTALTLLQSGIRPYQGRPAVGALLARAMSLQQRLPHVATGSPTALIAPSRDMDIRVRLQAHSSPLSAR
jgi:tetratricopeptide (TPR) repeat protein